MAYTPYTERMSSWTPGDPKKVATKDKPPPPKRKGEEAVGFIEFRGKYDVVLPAELDSLPDNELVRLIMQRGNVDEARAREALAILPGGRRDVMVYDRV